MVARYCQHRPCWLAGCNKMYHVPVMWRWVCAAVDLENPRRVVNVGGEYWRTRNRNRCVIGSCEVPPRYHGVVAAAHTGTFVWPPRGCAQLDAAATPSNSSQREAAVVRVCSN